MGKVNGVVRIGVLGDFDPTKVSHPATNAAIHDAAQYISVETDVVWIPTPSLLAKDTADRLRQFDCIWASSGSPYLSLDGMINGIRISRESGRPFVAT